jgi:hypothetical protein
MRKWSFANSAKAGPLPGFCAEDGSRRPEGNQRDQAFRALIERMVRAPGAGVAWGEVGAKLVAHLVTVLERIGNGGSEAVAPSPERYPWEFL